MKHRIGTILVLAVVCLTISSGFVGATDDRSSLGITAVVSEAIAYQGYLTEKGQPVDASLAMAFRLYSDGACTTQVGAAIDAGTVEVTDGVFSVELPVDQEDFDGQGLWVEATVDGTAVGCEEILPAPYALSLRPGAEIKGAPGLAGSLLSAGTTNGSVEGSLVQGLLLGSAAVYGTSDIGLTSYGGYFQNTATDGTAAWFNGDTAAHFVGDVEQEDDDDGLVKAAAAVYCAQSASTVHRQFNRNGGTITVVNGATLGSCTIDFGGFNIDDRFWSATSIEADYPRGVSCEVVAANKDQLRCYNWNPAGSGFDGSIIVLVY